MFNQIGVPGIIILLVLAFIVFGAKNLPMMGRSLGSAVKEFKEGVTGKQQKDGED
ncbi:twin-arginine translocase TatA/TatE family subunit [Paenibacillus sp. EZ-K15]|uniref:twin-arginine translocase TatA/TatE family subunit n=1 Tax=Paenibacillus sp. EZ-K15 TaxID=2044275 RepID=UPI000BF4377C|nr:twin-arginine translocase TatA/TatE family subunit [Paenibacillus sp. EZ-K15]